MGLEPQVRERMSSIATNCAAAVTMAAGALQPAFGCRISRSLQDTPYHVCFSACSNTGHFCGAFTDIRKLQVPEPA